MKPTIRCLFEQSGTFKNEFKKLGYEAYDYDILNDYGETDYQIDLFKEIENAYVGGVSIFDDFTNDIVLSFFPCVCFENQKNMWFLGNSYSQRNWADIQKLEKNIEMHKELHYNYCLVCKMFIVCLKKGIKMIMENPYSEIHYLKRNFCIKPKVIDMNRRERGDYFVKPTQYWFVNCEPKNNFIMEAQIIMPKKDIINTHDRKERSEISKEYANRFIREFILESEEL